MQILSARITVMVDGAALSVEADAVLQIPTPARTAKLDGAGRVAGATEEYRAPGVTVTRIATPDFDPLALAAKTDMTVVVDNGAGRSWVLSGATLANQTDLNVKEATAPLEFIGASLEPV